MNNDELNIDIDHELQEKYKMLGMKINSNQFRRQYLAGNLCLDKISDDYIKDIKAYYSTFTNRKINMINHIVYKNLTGKEDVRILSREVLRQDLIPFFNDIGMINTFTDKNMYDILFHQYNQPESVIKNVRGHYFTNKNRQITKKQAKKILLETYPEYIIKNSDIENGKTINKLTVKDDHFLMNNEKFNFNELESFYNSNFVVQKIIKQHPEMAKLHPYSVNTLRIVTLRWNDKINHIYTFCRFGVDYDIKDNAGRGGIVVGISDNGEFLNYGANKYSIFHKHPTTNIKISELNKVPNYDQCIQLVKKMHSNILHQNLVSWDIAIEETGKPIFIEANFFGSAILNQIALKRPLFGDLTDNILSTAYKSIPKLEKINTFTHYRELKEKHDKNKQKLRNSRKRNRKLNNKLKNEQKNKKKRIAKYRQEIGHLEQTIGSLQKEINQMKNSRSWRYTSFLRKK